MPFTVMTTDLLSSLLLFSEKLSTLSWEQKRSAYIRIGCWRSMSCDILLERAERKPHTTCVVQINLGRTCWVEHFLLVEFTFHPLPLHKALHLIFILFWASLLSFLNKNNVVIHKTSWAESLPMKSTKRRCYLINSDWIYMFCLLRRHTVNTMANCPRHPRSRGTKKGCDGSQHRHFGSGKGNLKL